MQKAKCVFNKIIRKINMKMKMKSISQRYDINKHRARHGHKYTKHKNCHRVMMLICIKQQLSNIWSSVHEKVKQHWGWVEKNYCLSKEGN